MAERGETRGRQNRVLHLVAEQAAGIPDAPSHTNAHIESPSHTNAHIHKRNRKHINHLSLARFWKQGKKANVLILVLASAIVV